MKKVLCLGCSLLLLLGLGGCAKNPEKLREEYPFVNDIYLVGKEGFISYTPKGLCSQMAGTTGIYVVSVTGELQWAEDSAQWEKHKEYSISRQAEITRVIRGEMEKGECILSGHTVSSGFICEMEIGEEAIVFATVEEGELLGAASNYVFRIAPSNQIVPMSPSPEQEGYLGMDAEEFIAEVEGYWDEYHEE